MNDVPLRNAAQLWLSKEGFCVSASGRRRACEYIVVPVPAQL
jgi:hypothetical protein